MTGEEVHGAVAARHNLPRSVHGRSFYTSNHLSPQHFPGLTEMSNSEDYVLQVIQQPELAKVTAAKEKGTTSIMMSLALQAANPDFFVVRTPIDPPPVIELALQGTDPSRYTDSDIASKQNTEARRTFLHSPFFFGNIELESADPAKPLTQPQAALLGGNLVSSLHKVKLQDNRGKPVEAGQSAVH